MKITVEPTRGRVAVYDEGGIQRRIVYFNISIPTYLYTQIYNKILGCIKSAEKEKETRKYIYIYIMHSGERWSAGNIQRRVVSLKHANDPQ